MLFHVAIVYLLCISIGRPVMPVSLNGGMRMNSWFDVFHLGDGKKYDEEGQMKATAEG